MSLTKLESFVKYCAEHPEQRFWQALRNWAGVNFILFSSHYDANMFNDEYLKNKHVTTKDTFYEDN